MHLQQSHKKIKNNFFVHILCLVNFLILLLPKYVIYIINVMQNKQTLFRYPINLIFK